MNQRQDFPLVPLGVGEILDRAVTLVVRDFVRVLLVICAVAVPIAILRYFGTPDVGQMMRDIINVSQHPGPGQAAELQRVLSSSSVLAHANVFTALTYLCALFASPLGGGAAIVFLASSYRGTLQTFDQVYRSALRRWFAILVVALGYLGIFIACLIVFAIVLFVVILAFAGLGALLRANPIGVGVVAVIAFGILFIAIMVVLGFGLIAYQFSMIDVIVAQPNPMTAIGSGLRRTFARAVRKRMFALVLVYLAVTFGISLLSAATVGLLAAFVPQRAIVEAIATAIQIVAQMIILSFTVVAYYDVRVRREGLDLESDPAIVVPSV